MPKVASAAYAKKRYEEAIKARGGAKAWYDCGEKVYEGGVQKVAECMKSLKLQTDESTWAKNYEFAYTTAKGT